MHMQSITLLSVAGLKLFAIMISPTLKCKVGVGGKQESINRAGMPHTRPTLLCRGNCSNMRSTNCLQARLD